VGVLQDMGNYFSCCSLVQQLGYTAQNLLNALCCFFDIKLMETLYIMILFLDILILTTADSEVQSSDIMYIFISRAEFFVARMCGI
jgi:hypothetical protein